MYCSKCGKEVQANGKFCAACGCAIHASPIPNPPRRTSPWKWIIPCIALLVIAVAASVIVGASRSKKSVKDEAGDRQSTSVSTRDTTLDAPDTAAVNQSTTITAPAATPIPMADYEWLESQPALQTKRTNFAPQKWDKENFKLSSRRYMHGVGITMKGSGYEKVVTPEAGDVWEEPYAETYLDVAFGRRFFKMTFDIGFDNAIPSRWGAPETNGNARLIIKDQGADQVLYDTGVIDFAFSDYFVSLDTRDVEVLRIVYQVSPVTEKQKTSLNILLGKALMYKYGDGYEQTADYTPMLDALPTDYAQFEPYATDYIESFILRGFREEYEREELYCFTDEEMELVLNGVYALSGKWVARKELWNYFTTKPWYYPVRADITVEEKNSFQQAKENTIVAYMKDMGWR